MKPIFLIVGASGSGKSTLVEELEVQCNVKAIPSYTTRPPRHTNEKGHTFITDDEFDNLENIIAYAETTNARYCVTQEMFDNEEYTLYVIDNSGIKFLKKNYKGNRPMHVIYITAPLKQRYERMLKRADNNPDPIGFALERIEHDAIEFRDVDWDVNIDNADGTFSESFASLCTYYNMFVNAVTDNE